MNLFFQLYLDMDINQIELLWMYNFSQKRSSDVKHSKFEIKGLTKVIWLI